MRDKYFNFLCNEYKRLNLAPLGLNEFNEFIDSPRGLKNFISFCVKQKKSEKNKRKGLHTLFENVDIESKPSQETSQKTI